MTFPPYAYVPGVNARHDPSFFAPFHASVSGEMGCDELAQTLAWRAGWEYVQKGYYWEAHEILEPVWMALPSDSVARSFVQAIIQTANAALKLEMLRPKATIRLCSIVRELLLSMQGHQMVLGLQLAEVERFLDEVNDRAESAINFSKQNNAL